LQNPKERNFSKMTKEEFEKEIGVKIPENVFSVIQMVYLYHPAIDYQSEQGRKDLAKIWKLPGSEYIICDMFERAKKYKEIEDKNQKLYMEIEKMKHQIEENNDEKKLLF